MNANRDFPKRNQFDVARTVEIFDQKTSFATQIKYSEDQKTSKGHLPIKIGFTDYCINALDSYIPDLLPQPKKGVFADLLLALEQYLIRERLLSTVEQRMLQIPRFSQSVERFGRSWFRLRTCTASNYMDMVNGCQFRLIDIILI